MALSPLKLEMVDLLADYVNPYFAQHWNFFAPKPPTEDTWVVTRARLAPAGSVSGTVQTTPWIDLTEPLIDAVAHDRLTPLFLVELGLSNAATSFMNRLSKNPAATVTKDGKAYLKNTVPADVDPMDLAYMRRTAIASLETQYPASAIRQIQVGIEIYRYPRFTNRNASAPPPKGSLITTPWASAQFVTPYCCTSHRPAARRLP